jgi:hypothetical protein
MGQTKRCIRCKKDRAVDTETGLCRSCTETVNARLRDPKAPWNRPAPPTGRGIN